LDGPLLVHCEKRGGDKWRASVECPHCQHGQFFDFFRHVNGKKGPDGEHLTETAQIYCEVCGAAWSEGQRTRALWEGSRWQIYRARRPACGGWPVSNSHAGFQAGKEYSPWAKDWPADVAKKWVDAQGDETLIGVWWNTQRGIPYKRKVGVQVETDTLLARREVYAAEVPDGVALLTVGADSQGDRVEGSIAPSGDHRVT
jgi:phage terminase large subunit GpA-like protein